MRSLLAVLQYVVAFGFILLGLHTWVHYRRRRLDHLLHLSLALGLLGLTALVGRLIEQTEYGYVLMGVVALVTTVGSAYFLLEFRNDFLPISSLMKTLARGAAAAVIVVAILAPVPFEANARYSAGDVAVLSAIGLLWVLFVGEPVVRFLLAARDRPAVQAARLRALCIGYATLILLVGLSVFEHPNDEVSLGVAVNSLALAMIPVLYVAFDPPRWVRRVWRGHDENALQMAASLSSYAPNREVLAERALEGAITFAGADAGFLVGPTRVLASRNLSEDEIASLEEKLREMPGEEVELRDGSHRYGTAVALETAAGRGMLGLIMGPFTPLFGSDELSRLVAYGEIVSISLERVGLAESVEEERTRNESLLGALSDMGEGFVVTDGRRFLFANDAYCRMSGYTSEEVLAFDSVWALTAPEDVETLKERVGSRLAGGAVQDHYEAALVHKNGHKVDVEVSVKLMTTEEGPRILSIVRDISERKRLERFREQFITDAAHELRTPVTTLVGMSSLLSKRRRLNEAQIDDAIQALERQGTRLMRLVNNLLDLAELRQGRTSVELVPIVLNDVLTDVLATLPAPPGKSVTTDVPEDLTVIADPSRLDQIFSNLLNNAYKYGGENIGVVAVEQRDRVRVTVVDDGTGVPENLLPQLFDTFTRGDNSGRIQGSGLGLAIVKMLAESCNGSISYEGSNGTGARFVVTLDGSASLT